jgi:BirA family biotin operon repressor/biotin-[acetyl-CoA-carboxylase] ligase
MIKLEKILENSFVVATEYYESIASTNDRALAAAAEPGARLPLLLVADAQTAGRGRGSNRWWTGPGSLAFSLLMPSGARSTGFSRNETSADATLLPECGRLKPVLPAPRPPVLMSLAVGVALVDALVPLVPGHEIGIHWPNDVMLDGRKLAGVLIEVLPDGKQVIGIGINVNNTAADAPADLRPRVATLRDATGKCHDSTELLISLLKCLERRLAELALTPEQIASRTDELCLQRGRVLQVCQGERTIAGTCHGITGDGALLLQSADRRHIIYSGTVAPADSDLQYLGPRY